MHCVLNKHRIGNKKKHKVSFLMLINFVTDLGLGHKALEISW